MSSAKADVIEEEILDRMPPRAPFCYEVAIDLVVPLQKGDLKPEVAPLG